jgi:hypothetical protein
MEEGPRRFFFGEVESESPGTLESDASGWFFVPVEVRNLPLSMPDMSLLEEDRNASRTISIGSAPCTATGVPTTAESKRRIVVRRVAERCLICTAGLGKEQVTSVFPRELFLVSSSS